MFCRCWPWHLRGCCSIRSVYAVFLFLSASSSSLLSSPSPDNGLSLIFSPLAIVLVQSFLLSSILFVPSSLTPYPPRHPLRDHCFLLPARPFAIYPCVVDLWTWSQSSASRAPRPSSRTAPRSFVYPAVDEGCPDNCSPILPVLEPSHRRTSVLSVRFSSGFEFLELDPHTL